MPSERESIDIKKAMTYDLLQIIEAEPDRTYTVEELKRILNVYIKGLEQ